MQQVSINPSKKIPKTAISIAITIIVIFMAMILRHYPGWTNPDSIDQYNQATTGIYYDWHPPIMAHLWALFRTFSITSGPFYVFHIFFYWLGICIIALALVFTGHRRTAWAIVAVGLSPAFVILTFEILSDTGLTVSFLSAFAILFWHRVNRKKLHLSLILLVVVLIMYGVLVRANGVFAGAPIIIYAFFPKVTFRPIQLIFGCVVIIVSTLALTPLINRDVFHAHPSYPIYSLEVFDLAGIAAHSHDLSVLGSDLAMPEQQLHKCYTPVFWDTFNKGEKCSFIWDLLDSHVKAGAPLDLTNLWLKAIARHPLAYMEHRTSHFNQELGFIVPRHQAEWHVLLKLSRGKDFDASPFRSTTWKIWDYVKENPFFTPAFSFVLSSLLLFLSWPRKAIPNTAIRNAIFCLAISGVTYSLGYLFIGVGSSVLRYHFWTMLSALIALTLYLADRSSSPLRRSELACLCILGIAAISIFLAQIILGDALYFP